MNFLRNLFLIYLLSFNGLFLAGALDVPYLSGRVVDIANVLSDADYRKISLLLKENEQKTSNQFAVLVVSSLEDEILETYSLRVVEEWKLGRKDRDNGVLLLVSIQDRKLRFEVGYGLEGSLPDTLCAQIIRNEIAPYFRNQAYGDGIFNGLQAAIKATRGEYKANANGFDSAFKNRMPLPIALLFGAFIFGILGLFTFFCLFVPSGSGWFLYFFLIPFWAMFPLMVLPMGLSMWVFGIYFFMVPVFRLLLPHTHWGKKMLKTGMFSNQGGTRWSSRAGGWASGGRGWSSGGGGFSGGGGSFGGGGSSGSW